MNKKDFYNISTKGRYAYQLMCTEKYLITKYPDKDFTKIFEILWQGTNGMYWDDLADYIVELTPHYLLENKKYIKEDFDVITEEQYYYFYSLLKDIGEDFEELFEYLKEMAFIYEGTEIRLPGIESIDIVFKTIKMLKKNNISLPDINLVKFSTTDQFYGYGNKFDGTKLSIILNKS